MILIQCAQGSEEKRGSIKAGARIGKLTAVEICGKSNDGHLKWKCVCDCGQTVERQTNQLRSRGIKSCGCIQKELQSKHGMKGSREYVSWAAAKIRCMNPDDKSYPKYGGRGITVCKEWIESFEEFFKSMGPRPPNTTLERKDVNGNYEPGNCVWATPQEQARNRRNSIHVTWNGAYMHLADVAKEMGISYGAAFMRFKRGKLYENSPL